MTTIIQLTDLIILSVVRLVEHFRSHPQVVPHSCQHRVPPVKLNVIKCTFSHGTIFDKIKTMHTHPQRWHAAFKGNSAEILSAGRPMFEMKFRSKENETFWNACIPAEREHEGFKAPTACFICLYQDGNRPLRCSIAYTKLYFLRIGYCGSTEHARKQ